MTNSAPAAPAAKRFISADDLLRDGFALAERILDSGWRPTCLAGVWRGGAPVAVSVQEALAWHGVHLRHSVVGASSYSGIDERARQVTLWGVETLIDAMTPGDRLLIVDDVFDTGRTLEAILNALRTVEGGERPGLVRTAVPYFKPRRNATALTPDYFIHETEDWLVFPHELDGLTPEEVAAHKPVSAGFVNAKR